MKTVDANTLNNIINTCIANGTPYEERPQLSDEQYEFLKEGEEK